MSVAYNEVTFLLVVLHAHSLIISYIPKPTNVTMCASCSSDSKAHHACAQRMIR